MKARLIIFKIGVYIIKIKTCESTTISISMDSLFYLHSNHRGLLASGSHISSFCNFGHFYLIHLTKNDLVD
jgi:hypothetical protein